MSLLHEVEVVRGDDLSRYLMLETETIDRRQYGRMI